MTRDVQEQGVVGVCSWLRVPLSAGWLASVDCDCEAGTEVSSVECRVSSSFARRGRRAQMVPGVLVLMKSGLARYGKREWSAERG
jgi:hypothetical protein